METNKFSTFLNIETCDDKKAPQPPKKKSIMFLEDQLLF